MRQNSTYSSTVCAVMSQGYAEQMRAMYDREDLTPPRLDPQTSGSSSQGSSSQSSQRAVCRAGRVRNVPAFPGSRIVPTRWIGSRDIAYQRVIKFGTTKVPKLTKSTLVNMEVYRLIQ